MPADEIDTSVNAAAERISGLLDADGHANSDPERLSRAHPDYDPENDERETGQRQRRRPGRDRQGRFKPADEETELEDNPVTAQDSDTDAESDDANTDDESDGDNTDSDDDGDNDTSDDTEDAEGEDTDDEITSLDQLAKAFEVEVDELLGTLTDTFKADGEEVTVTLADLRSGYQKGLNYARDKQALVNDRRTFNVEQGNRMQQVQDEHAAVAQSFNVLEQLLAQELQSPEMLDLRQNNAAEWSARQQEIGQRLGQLRQYRQQAALNYQATTQNNLKQLRDAENKALLEAIPEFSSEHANIAHNIMESLGFVSEEIAQVFDHRQVLGALELATLRDENARMQKELTELKKQAEAGKNAIRKLKSDKVPNTLKPSSGSQSTDKKGLRRNKLTQLKKRAKASGSTADAARVIENLI